MGVSKVIYGGQTLIDLTSDTVTPDKLTKDVTAHGANGEQIVGTCTYDADTQDATATAAEILKDKVAYVRGVKVTGSMPNIGAVEGFITSKDEVYTVPQGSHDGSGKVQIAVAEQAKLIPDNIRQGVTILGVVGDMSGTEDVKAESKTVTPSTSEQTILPGDGFNYLSQVVVAAIPYVESENAAGGMTVTIG